MLYRVQPGDTLYKLAQQLGTTIQQLVELNQIENPDVLEVGQILLVPDGDIIEFRPKNFDYKLVDGLLLVFFTQRDSYSQGEPINLNLIKVNIGSSPVTLNYRSGQRVDFQAYRNSNRIWTWSQGRFFTQEIREISLSPGRALVYRKQWGQLDSDEEQVEAGIYKIAGWNVARQIREERLSIFVEVRE